MFKKILFPVDLSEGMVRIAPIVKEMANRFDADIHCVYGLNVAAYFANINMIPAYVTDFEAQAMVKVKEKMNGFVMDHFPGMNVTTKILSGRPGDMIVEYARNSKMDLIVMGHSATGIERAIMGSVAGHVVKHSPVPVLVVSPEALTEKEHSA